MISSLSRQTNLLLSVVASFLLFGAPIAHAGKAPATPDHWVGTWAASPYALENSEITFGATDTTLRQIVHTSLGGSLVRVEFTNEFGTEPLTIGAAHLALTANGPTSGEISLASAQALTFNGSPTVTIPAGAMALSDPAALKVPAQSDLAISLFLPAQKISRVTHHGSAFQTNYMTAGNVVGLKSLADAKTFDSWYFVKAVDVKTPGDTGAVVAFGDSITDGSSSTKDTNGRWPDALARRLQADKKLKRLGVLNEGIGGNRILHTGNAENALARFDRDVLGQAGVRYLVLLEGINDIGVAYGPKDPRDVVTADDLILGLAQLTERAHAHGIKVIGATITPYVGANYSSPAGEAVRQSVNTWVRTNKSLDGFVDFDKAVRDPAHPDTFSPASDSGDHLHPNDAGLKAMGDAFDLKLFAPEK